MLAALLAPVPEEHLLSGQAVCREKGKVVFGSMSWEVFSKLDQLLLPKKECEALIYASDAARPISPANVTWKGRYVGHTHSRGGAHKDGMAFRPKSTENYAADNRGHWAVFWEVQGLAPLPPSEHIKVGLLQGHGQSRGFLKSFVPRGPILINAV